MGLIVVPTHLQNKTQVDWV